MFTRRSGRGNKGDQTVEHGALPDGDMTIVAGDTEVPIRIEGSRLIVDISGIKGERKYVTVDTLKGDEFSQAVQKVELNETGMLFVAGVTGEGPREFAWEAINPVKREQG